MALISKRTTAGFTLAEVMVTVAIMSILALVGTKLVSSVYQTWRSTQVRTEVQRDARTILNLIQKSAKQASAASLTISTADPAEPPYSQLQFSTPAGTTYLFYQQGGNVNMSVTPPGGSTSSTVLAKNLLYMAFSYPDTGQTNLINVAMCFQETTYGTKEQNFFMTLEKMQIENP